MLLFKATLQLGNICASSVVLCRFPRLCWGTVLGVWLCSGTGARSFADESRSFVLPTKFLLQLQRGLCQASSGFPYKLQQGSSREVVPAHCCPERWEAPVAFLGWEGLWLEVSLPLSCSKQQRASLYWRKLWELAAEVWPSQLFLFCYRTKIWTDRSLSKCTYMSC